MAFVIAVQCTCEKKKGHKIYLMNGYRRIAREKKNPEKEERSFIIKV